MNIHIRVNILGQGWCGHKKKNRDNNQGIAKKFNEKTNKIISVGNRFKTIEEDIYENWDNDKEYLVDKRNNPEKYQGIPTGFPEIDRATGGWQPGELTIILGRTGQGKSILLLNFGQNAYRERYNVLYLTIELHMQQLKERWYSSATKTDFSKIKQPHKMANEEFNHMLESIEKDKNFHYNNRYKNFFRIVDRAENCNCEMLRSRIVNFEKINNVNVDLVIVDPLYLMTPSDLKADDKYGVIAMDLKLLARSLHKPIIAASQLNRESHKRHLHGKNVDTMDASFSDKLGHNCNNMIGITGDKYIGKLEFPKTRDASVSKIFIKKNFACMRFEIDKEKFGEHISEGQEENN